MLRLGLICGLALTLTACGEVTLTGEPAPVATSDGVASKLKMGVTKNELDVALGPDAGYERNPNNWDQACASYPYSDGKKYVHATFVKDSLISATDGHTLICTYEETATVPDA